MFEWDPGKAARNLEKHRVTFFEAASVFTDPEGLDLPDDAHSAAARRNWRIGMSDEGRVLTVEGRRWRGDPHHQRAGGES